MKKIFLLLMLGIFTFSLVKSQNLPKDSIYGNVKRIREKVIFLTAKENHQLLYNDDYGHSGFMNPESAIANFFDIWFSSDGCYYINYDRYFNRQRKVTKDIWFGKKDNFLHSYRYRYDDKHRLASKIDSSSYSYSTTNHYYSNYGDETIIRESPKFNSFSHLYKQYKDGKLMLSKSFNEKGNIDEYRYYYNAHGKLAYRTYKNPNSWKNTGERSWSYGVLDSVGNIYKDIVNEYDHAGRISSVLNYSIYEDEEHRKPVVTKQIKYSYKDQNLIRTMERYKAGESGYKHYQYDDTNRLVAEFCCNENVSDAKIVQKYFYKTHRINTLEFIEEDFTSKKMITHKVSFSYKYDTNNNWIEIIKHVDGKDLYKWIREIEYYDTDIPLK